MLHNLNSLPQVGTEGQASAWMESTLSGLQAALPISMWYSALKPGRKVLYSEFCNAHDLNTH